MEANLEAKPAMMPARHRELVESKISEIVVVDDSSDSGYEPRTKKIYIYPNRRMTRLQSFMNMLTPLIEQ